MPASGVSATRRTGQLLTGLGALVVLVALLAGTPIALLAFAGNPLPDHVPTLGEIGTTLTSRDDGQLFLRALALLGWAGWGTFVVSVLVELPARAMRRPAPRLPGMRRQQRMAAALIGSAALILVASPAATAAASLAAPAVSAPATNAAYAAPAGGASYATSAETYAGPVTGTGYGPAAGTGWAAPNGTPGYVAVRAATPGYAAPGGTLAAPGTGTAPAVPGVGSAAGALVNAALRDSTPPPPAEPVYRVEKDDYLGHIADRYLGDFDRYRELAKYNKISNPDRIRPGQMLRLPSEAVDRGVREHATGLVAMPNTPAAPGATAPATPPAPPQEPRVVPMPVDPPAGPGDISLAGGAAAPVRADSPNRSLAVSAVIAAASVVGAQIGAVMGLRRRSAGGTGRHRLDP